MDNYASYPMSPASLDTKFTVSKMVSDMNCAVSESSHIRTDIPKSKLSLNLIEQISVNDLEWNSMPYVQCH